MKRSEHSIRIRRARADEVAAIAAVLREAFLEYESSYTPTGFAATTPTSEQLLSRWHEGPVWVALRAGVIVGTIAAVSRGEALYVRSMAVLPAARGQRIGELLLGEVERFAVAQVYERLFLSTTPFLVRAIRLYKSWGFQHCGDGLQDLFGVPLFTMVKTLKPAD